MVAGKQHIKGTGAAVRTLLCFFVYLLFVHKELVGRNFWELAKFNMQTSSPFPSK